MLVLVSQALAVWATVAVNLPRWPFQHYGTAVGDHPTAHVVVVFDQRLEQSPNCWVLWLLHHHHHHQQDAALRASQRRRPFYPCAVAVVRAEIDVHVAFSANCAHTY